MNIKDEDLAAMVALRLDRTPAQCAAWIESADRVCGKDAARPWLCKRHEGVAARRCDMEEVPDLLFLRLVPHDGANDAFFPLH